MTLLSRVLAFFPGLVVGLAIASSLWLCLSTTWPTLLLRFVLLLFVLYGLPLCTYKLHNHFHKATEGVSYLKGEQYSPWWGTHQIQSVYIAFPVLETALRLLPGAFSFWLRLWGSQIGKRVYWGSIGEISDRGLLQVGDQALVGHRVGLYAHIIKPKRDNLFLYVKAIEIGEGAFVGSGSYIGAGVVITPGAYLESGSEVHPNKTVSQQKRSDANGLEHGHLKEIEKCVR